MAKLLNFASNRFGLFIGGALFLVAVIISNNFIFSIQVTGSGSYLEREVISIVNSSGAAKGRTLDGFDKPLAVSRILSLEGVTFCSIKKDGSVLKIDVQCDETLGGGTDYSPLRSDVDGVVKKVVALCGTPLVGEGDRVAKGDVVIGAYYSDGDGKKISGIAVGFAEIECRGTFSYFSEAYGDEGKAMAQSAAMLYAEGASISDMTAKPCEGGIMYEVAYSYLHTVKINME